MDGWKDLDRRMAAITGKTVLPDELPRDDDAEINDLLDQLEGRVSDQESGGRQKVRNPRTGAAGRFQVLPSNIPVWTRKHLGREMSVDEYLNDPDAQSKVFRGEFGEYLKAGLKRSNGDKEAAVRRAAAAWYGGMGAMERFNNAKRFRADEPSFKEYTDAIVSKWKSAESNNFDVNAIVSDLNSRMAKIINSSSQSAPQTQPVPTPRFDKQGNPVTAMGGLDTLAPTVATPEPTGEFSVRGVQKAMEALNALNASRNAGYAEYLKQSQLTDSPDARKAYNDALTLAPDAFKPNVAPDAQTQPQPAQTTPQGQLRQKTEQIKQQVAEKVAPLTGVARSQRITLAGRRPNQTFREYFDQEINRLGREAVPEATPEDVKAAQDASPTTVAGREWNADIERGYAERYASGELDAVNLNATPSFIDAIKRAVEARKKREKAQVRIDAGERDLDVLLDEGLITPEAFTTAEYERKNAEAAEEAARQKFLAENTVSDTPSNFLQGVGAARFGGGYGQTTNVGGEGRTIRPDTQSLDDVLRKYGSAQQYYKEQERIKEEYKYRYMAGPSEFVTNIARSIAAAPAFAGQAGVIAVTDLNPWLRGVTAEQNPVYQALGAYRQQLEASRNPDLDQWYLKDLPDGLGQLASQAILAPFTGGASVLLPIAQGAVTQYDEATKAGAKMRDRNIATIVGGLAAVPEVLLNLRYIGKAIPKNQFTGLLNAWSEKLFGNLAKVLPEAEARELTKRTIGAFVTQAAKNGVLGFATEMTQEGLEDIGNKATAKLTYKPEATWSDVFIPNADEKRGYFVAGLIGAFGGNVNLVVSKLSDSELKRSDEVLAEQLQKGLIEVEQAQTLAREIADEAAKRNVSLKPQGTVEQLVKGAVDRFLAENPAQRKVGTGQFETVAPIAAPETALAPTPEAVPVEETPVEAPVAELSPVPTVETAPEVSPEASLPETPQDTSLTAEPVESAPIGDELDAVLAEAETVAPTVNEEQFVKGLAVKPREIVAETPLASPRDTDIAAILTAARAENANVSDTEIQEFEESLRKADDKVFASQRNYWLKGNSLPSRAVSKVTTNTADDFQRFTNAMTPLQRGKVQKQLEKQVRYDGNTYTYRTWIESLVADGATIASTRERARITPSRRREMESEIARLRRAATEARGDERQRIKDEQLEPLVRALNDGYELREINVLRQTDGTSFGADALGVAGLNYAKFLLGDTQPKVTPSVPETPKGIKFAKKENGELKTQSEYTNEEWKEYTRSVIESKLAEQKAVSQPVEAKPAEKAKELPEVEYALWGKPLAEVRKGVFTGGMNVGFNDGANGLTWADRETYQSVHRGAVERALKENKPVPESVLADYPDLAEKYAKKEPVKKTAKTEQVRDDVSKKAGKVDTSNVQTETDNDIETLPISQRVTPEDLDDVDFTREEVARSVETDKIFKRTGFTQKQLEWFVEEIQNRYDNWVDDKDVADEVRKANKDIEATQKEIITAQAQVARLEKVLRDFETLRETAGHDNFEVTTQSATSEGKALAWELGDARKYAGSKMRLSRVNDKITEQAQRVEIARDVVDSLKRQMQIHREHVADVSENAIRIKIPGDGTFAFYSKGGLDNIHKKLTGKTVDEFRAASDKTLKPKQETTAYDRFKADTAKPSGRPLTGRPKDDILLEREYQNEYERVNGPMSKAQAETAFYERTFDIQNDKDRERVRTAVAKLKTQPSWQDGTILKSVADISEWDSEAYDKQLDGITLERNKDGKILAPNGKVSNIQNERLAKVIRSKNFLEWFGDSKVVDGNNEPLVVYHGTPNVFDAFDDAFKASSNRNELANAISSYGHFFTHRTDIAEFYADDRISPFSGKRITDEPTGQPNIIPVFLAISNPQVLSLDRLYHLAKRSILETKNYDGVIASDNGIEPSATSEFVAFSPNQIKSIFNRGSFSPDEDSILKSVASEPAEVSDLGFFSAVEQTILDKVPAKASVDQVKAILSPSKSQVKQEELEWRDREGFLDGKKSVTKDELLAFVRANNVRLEEVVKGDKPRQLQVSHIVEKRDHWLVYFTNGQAQDVDKTKAATRTEAGELALQSFEQYAPASSDPKFSKYQLKGDRENYREWLLTMPSGALNTTERYQELSDIADRRDLTDAEQAEMVALERVEFNNESQSAGGVFRSEHFEEPNIVVHFRTNERVDADGKRTLFIEEIQSDWAQEGREKGFNVNVDREALQKELTEVISKRARAHSADDYHALHDREMELTKQLNSTSVPNMPFKQSRLWAMLAFKRMLRHAVENGFDQVAWTTGEQQADRYNLAKVVKEIKVEPIESLTPSDARLVKLELLAAPDVTLTIDKDGIVTDVQSVQPEFDKAIGKPLSGFIGKDPAKKILDDGMTSLKGDDLTIGDKGMKGFYDEIVPNSVNKYVKKWGGRVTTTSLNTTPDPRTVKDTDSAYVRAAQSFQDSNGSVSIDDLRSAYPDAAENELRNAIKAVQGSTVHSLTITDAMRDSVMQGQPLFSKSDLRALARVEYASDLVDGVTSSITDDGHLNLSEHASEMVRRTLAELSNTNEQPFDGATITGNTLKRIARRLESFAADLDANGYDSKPVRELADNLKKTAGNNYSVLYVYEEALPEETVHVQDLNAGRTDAQALAKLKESPFWTNPGDKFTKQYPRISDADKASEIAAKLATDQASKYGWDKVADFETEKQKFLNEWANGIIRRNLDKLQTEDQWDDFTKSYPTITTYAGNKKSDTRASGKSGTTRPDTKAGQEKGTAEKGQEPVEGAESPSEEEARQEADRRLPADGELKPRKTVTSLEERGYIAPGDITGENRYYQTISRDAAKAVAQERIERIGLAHAVAEAIQPAETVSSAEQAFRMEVAELLLGQAAELAETNVEASAAKYNDAFDVIATLAVESTAYGQAISQLANWTRENPQTAVAYLARRRKRNNLDPLTPEQATQIVEDARQVAEYKEQLDKANEKVANLEADVERLDTAIAEAQETVNTQKRTLTVLRRLYSYWKNKKGGNAKRQRKTVRERIAELEAKKADALERLRERFGTDVLKSVVLSVADVSDWDSASYDRQLESIELTRNADGKILAPNGKVSKIQNERLAKVIRSKEFIAWFGDWINAPEKASKVVDDNGEPLEVIHATDADIEEFNPNHAAGWGTGVYFSQVSEPNGEWYGDTEYRVFLNLRNPSNGFLPKGANRTSVGQARIDKLIESGIYEEADRVSLTEDDDLLRDEWQENGEFANRVLREMGFDGVIAYGNIGTELEYVAFEPNQIKSIFNRGSFSPSDDSILKSVADEPITDDVFEMLADLAELGILEDKPYTDLMAELADVTNGAIEPDVLSQAHSAAMARIEDEVQGRREKAQQAREADPELQAKYDALKATREIRKEHRQRAKDFLKATGQAVNTFERELMARAKAQNLPEYVVTAAMMFSDKSLSQADITRKLRERYPNEIKDGAAAMNAATKAAKFRSDVYKELRDERAAKRAEKNEASGEAQKAKQTYNNAFGKFRKRMEGLEKAPPSRVDRIIGIRKGLMVSALSTMWINVVGGAATSGLKTTSDIFTLALNKGLAQFGMESVAPDAIAAQVQFRELLGLDRDGKLGLDAVRQIFREARAAAHLAASHEFSDKTMSSRAQQVLNENPEWVDELFRAYNSDIEAHREVLRKSFKEAVGKEKIGAGVDAALDMAEYIADKANFLNRFQEFLIRNIEFDRALNVALANRGISLAKTIENKQWGNITGDDLAYAVRSALEVTYALRPKPGTAGATLVNLGKGTYKIPMMYVAPFANFIWNASRQVAQYTPGVGIAQKVLRSKNENKEVRTWTDAMKTLSPRDAANQIIGTSILIGIASMLRSIGSDDDDWKKIKVPFMTDQDGKQMYVDVGNWWPLTPFFWMANKINRTIDGKPLFSSDDPEEIAFEILEATVGINERTFDATVWKLVKSIPGAGSDVVSAAFTSSSLDGLLSKLATSSASDGDVAKVWYNFQKLGGEEIGIVTRPFKSFKDIAAFVDTFQKDGKENADLDLLDFPFEDAATKNVPFRNTIWQAAGAKPKKRVTGEDMQQPRGSIGGVEVTPALRIFGYNFTSDYRRKEPTPAIKKARSFMFEPKESDGLPESRRTSMWKGQIYRMIEDAGQDTDKQVRVREIIDSAESRGMFTAQSADRMRSMVGKTPIQSAVVGVSRKQTGNKPSPFNQVLALANETELTELLRMVTAKLIAEQTKREMSAADDDPTKPKKPKKPSATIMELEKEQQTIMGEIERRKKE